MKKKIMSSFRRILAEVGRNEMLMRMYPPLFFIIAGIYVSICFVFLFFLKNGTM